MLAFFVFQHISCIYRTYFLMDFELIVIKFLDKRSSVFEVVKNKSLYKLVIFKQTIQNLELRLIQSPRTIQFTLLKESIFAWPIITKKNAKATYIVDYTLFILPFFILGCLVFKKANTKLSLTEKYFLKRHVLDYLLLLCLFNKIL